MKTRPGPGTVSYLSSMIIDPSILREPSASEKNLFRETLRMLQLTPWVHKNQLTTSSPTSERLSKATDRPPFLAGVDGALALTKFFESQKEQADGKQILQRLSPYAKISKNWFNWHSQTGPSSWCWHLAKPKLIQSITDRFLLDVEDTLHEDVGFHRFCAIS